mmetsp:Transcript_2176/g.5774  ORF Transcript_2176/g.5774 Transcript_2176/m.5774 type:complete len:205 (+) Transcript_2176:1699-2313(+)
MFAQPTFFGIIFVRRNIAEPRFILCNDGDSASSTILPSLARTHFGFFAKATRRQCRKLAKAERCHMTDMLQYFLDANRISFIAFDVADQSMHICRTEPSSSINIPSSTRDSFGSKRFAVSCAFSCTNIVGGVWSELRSPSPELIPFTALSIPPPRSFAISPVHIVCCETLTKLQSDQHHPHHLPPLPILWTLKMLFLLICVRNV